MEINFTLMQHGKVVDIRMFIAKLERLYISMGPAHQRKEQHRPMYMERMRMAIRLHRLRSMELNMRRQMVLNTLNRQQQMVRYMLLYKVNYMPMVLGLLLQVVLRCHCNYDVLLVSWMLLRMVMRLVVRREVLHSNLV